MTEPTPSSRWAVTMAADVRRYAADRLGAAGAAAWMSAPGPDGRSPDALLAAGEWGEAVRRALAALDRPEDRP